MPGKSKSSGKAASPRVVVVALKQAGGGIPVAEETKRVVKKLTDRVRRSKVGKVEAVHVFPRFGQFSIKADNNVIESLSRQPEVDCVMENDSVAL